MKFLIVFSYFIFSLAPLTLSADEHGHEKKAAPAKEHHDEDDHDHEKEEHKEKGSHGHEEHEEEENSQVGPDKGITEADEHKGIKLSPEAEKNFEILKVAVSQELVTLPISTIVTAGEEVNLFRYRDGFYKLIDFITVSQKNNQIIVKSKDLAKGDFIVTQGLGFLRIAEISAFGGAPEGHSH